MADKIIPAALRRGRQSSTKIPIPPGLKLVRDRKTGEIKYIYHRKSGMRITAALGTPEFWTQYLALEQGAKKPRLVGVKRVVRKGYVDHYHQNRDGTLTRIEAPPDTPAFIAEVRRLNSGSKYQAGSWGALVAAYRDSAAFTRKADRTKQDYETTLAYLAELNEMALIQFDAEACEKIRDRALQQKKSRFADKVVTQLCLVLNWGKARPKEFGRFDNGASRLKKFGGSGNANRPHTQDENDIVFDEATGLLKIGIALAMFVSPRPSEVVKMLWSDYDGERIHWRQDKNGELQDKPAPPRLREILDAAPRYGEKILTRPDGKIWKYGTLAKSFRTLIARLEREGRIEKGFTFHGYRTTNATTLANLGGDIRAIQAELGDKTPAMAFHYSRKFDKRRAADRASRILHGEGDNVVAMPRRSPR